VADETIRIFSDLHFADHASRIRRLGQLRPLFDGVTHLVLNGDTLDTRPGPNTARTEDARSEVLDFFPRQVTRVTFLTGNHDADLTSTHALDLADGSVFVTHGDIVHDDIVPWSRDAAGIGPKIAAALAELPAAERSQLAARLEVWRRVARAIPQRHQAEPNRLRYALFFARDTVWPPSRIWKILRIWRQEPALVAAFARVHRPQARVVAVGHTHRPGVWRTPGGTLVVNTGSFTRLLGGCAIDLAGDRVTVRRIADRNGEFHLGETMAAFSLAELVASPRLEP
jgi:predicted phosphodiesterase